MLIDFSPEEISYIKNLIQKTDNSPIPKDSKSWKTREKLSELEHEQWSHWTKYMLDNLTEENIKKWKEQIDTKYKDLSESEKDSDREYADKVMNLIFGTEIKKNMVLPDPTSREIPNEKIIDTKSVPTYQNPTVVQGTHIAPIATVGTPLAESEDSKRKELIGKLVKKAEACGHKLSKDFGMIGE